MSSLKNDLPVTVPAETETTTRESLINQLEVIWDELGESDSERAKMLSELQEEYYSEQQQECRLEVYKTKLDQMLEIKRERELDFDYFRELIRKTSGSTSSVDDENETNLSLGLGELEKLRKQLHSLTENFKNQLSGIMETLRPLCEVLGLSYQKIRDEVDPDFFADDSSRCEGKNIKGTIDKLTATIHEYHELKKQNMKKLQRLATTMLELWDCLGTPDEEQQLFQNVTRCVAASEHQITEPDILSSGFLEYVEMEISRLQALKSSRCGKTESDSRMESDTSECENDGAKRPEMVETSRSNLKGLATTMLKLWDSLGTPNEERQLVQRDHRFVDASECKITEDVVPLSIVAVPLRFLVSLETEVHRLDQLRLSRLKGEVLKKKLEWEKICKETDMVAESDYDEWDYNIICMNAGYVDPQDLFDKLDRLITTAEKVRSRNDILNSVEEWLLAREEVLWLKTYEKDSNRYNAGSANRTLKRAEEDRTERARAEEARVERARAEEARVERARAERARAEGARAEGARAERAHAEARAEEARAEKARAVKARALAIQLPSRDRAMSA